MPQPYNLTNLTGSGDILGLVQSANSLTDNLLGVSLLMVIWVVIFVALKNYFTQAAMVTASFITMIVGILFFISGLVGQEIMIGVVVIFAISIIYSRVSNN